MAETFEKVTGDGEVETIEEVQFKITTTQLDKEETITVQGFRNRLAREKELRDGYITSITTMETQKTALETEAGKVVLKEKE